MNKYYVENFFSIQYAKYCRNQLTFVETAVEQKRWTFFGPQISYASVLLHCTVVYTCTVTVQGD